MTHPVHFDDYAENYDAALNQGLSATGEGKDYFAQRRVEWLSRCLRRSSFQPKSVMDYGCGDGSATPFLLTLPGVHSVLGVDTSARSIELAKRAFGGERSRFVQTTQYEPAAILDLAFCNG